MLDLAFEKHSELESKLFTSDYYSCCKNAQTAVMTIKKSCLHHRCWTLGRPVASSRESGWDCHRRRKRDEDSSDPGSGILPHGPDQQGAEDEELEVARQVPAFAHAHAEKMVSNWIPNSQFLIILFFLGTTDLWSIQETNVKFFFAKEIFDKLDKWVTYLQKKSCPNRLF